MVKDIKMFEAILFELVLFELVDFMEICEELSQEDIKDKCEKFGEDIQTYIDEDTREYEYLENKLQTIKDMWIEL